jgi:cystathionine beta-synthase
MSNLMQGSVSSILEAIGNTPIVKLHRMASHVSSEIYVKCEYLNPGGSMKDRIAVNIVNQAEREGLLKPGGTIVEATSGNTGMGLALVAAVRGYKTVFVMPDKMSQEKILALRAVGAKVVICPTDVDATDPRSYYCVSKRIADETPNAFYANQYHNPANPEAHYLSTGPEIWQQTQGHFDVFCAGMGTGGTLSGTGKFLREKMPHLSIIGVDPIGSLYYDFFKTGQVTTPHSYKVEGIGEDFFPSTMNLKILDDVVRVTDRECFMAARDLVRKEGILCGGSGGAAVAGALKYAQNSSKKLRILVHLPDTALRYLSKYLDDKWMHENGFLSQEPQPGTVRDVLANKPSQQVITASPKDSLKSVIQRMKQQGISQLPVLDEEKFIGIVHEKDVLNHVLQGEAKPDMPVASLVETQFSAVDLNTNIATLCALFNTSQVAVVLEKGSLVGIVTKIDLISHMAERVF